MYEGARAKTLRFWVPEPASRLEEPQQKKGEREEIRLEKDPDGTGLGILVSLLVSIKSAGKKLLEGFDTVKSQALPSGET